MEKDQQAIHLRELQVWVEYDSDRPRLYFVETPFTSKCGGEGWRPRVGHSWEFANAAYRFMKKCPAIEHARILSSSYIVQDERRNRFCTDCVSGETGQLLNDAPWYGDCSSTEAR